MAKKPAKKSVVKSDAVHVTVQFSIEGRVADDPLGVLTGLTKGTQRIDAYVDEVVTVARANRYTWAEIGGALGVTRQSAWERFATDK